jgi:pseudouridine synthase
VARARIQKVIAAAGLASRRGAEDLVRAGRVTVDGRLAIIGELVDPDMQRLEIDGNPLPAAVGPRSYWALNKPAGVVSTVRDRHADRTVMELLPPEASRGTRLYPVGRLDEESEGLLLFTDDGAWADLMLHPRYGVEREYMVGLDHSVMKAQKIALRTGVELEEGLARIDHLDDVTPAQVRSGLTAVIRRTLEAPGTFDSGGWLTLGFCGHQPHLAEEYISTGSLYLCAAAFLPLGLPAADPFWSSPTEDWTARRIWRGDDAPTDHAI